MQGPRYCLYLKKRWFAIVRRLPWIEQNNGEKPTLFLINETLDRFNGFKIFIKLDLKNAYHRIRIRKNDKWKVAFRTRYAHFEYTIMFYGLTNIPVIYQIYINKFWMGLIDEFCVVYFDDFFIYSKIRMEHIRHVKKILKRLKNFNLYVNLKKCDFFTIELEFLGFMVSITGVSMDKCKMETVVTWPKPRIYHKI